jgi:hypothetical protein
LTEEEGVVSIQSLEMLMQWLYHGRIGFGTLAPEETITAAIEFVRFADMCGVTGMESLIAEHVRTVIKANRDRRANGDLFTTDHIIAASHLPDRHPVRSMLAKAAVVDYFRYDNDDINFLKLSREVPNFAIDLLDAIKFTVKLGGRDNTYKDPINEPLNSSKGSQ